MQEDYLHYIWLHKKINLLELQTTTGKPLQILSVGHLNRHAGPDFFNAQIKINNLNWIGNVEIHVRSSDWYIHHHETDPAYDNVILHVVWEHDTEVFRKNNIPIPTLELKPYVSKTALDNYDRLFSKPQKWINCESDFGSVDRFTVENWLERLYFKRLEQKSEMIEQLLKSSNNDWEAVLFKLLAKNFGLNVNGDAFLSLANSIDISVLRKVRANVTQMEALFLGQANLLNDDLQEPYYLELQKTYQFLKQKFELETTNNIEVKFFRLRPSNFPTIRLSQLAQLYSKYPNMFSRIIQTQSIADFYKLFQIETTVFWQTHYTFGKVSRAVRKKITTSFVDLLIVNTIVPIKFSYARSIGMDINDEIIRLIGVVPPETNSIVQKFIGLGSPELSAMGSQALLQLKKMYCDKNKCLQCAIGNAVLS